MELMLVIVPEPELLAFPGFLVIVHNPEAGSPDKTTFPVATEQVG